MISSLRCVGMTSHGRATWQSTAVGASSSQCSVARRQDGRSRRGRSSRAAGGALACSWPPPLRDPESRKRLFALLQSMQNWAGVEGRNLRVDIRWAAGNTDDTRKYAAELTALAPDIILAAGSLALGPLLQATRTIPIVFTHVPDPVGAGFVDSLARPGGNATGFMELEYSMGGKWLELLKQIAPSVTRAAVLRDPSQGSGTNQFAAIQAVAPSLRVEVT